MDKVQCPPAISWLGEAHSADFVLYPPNTGVRCFVDRVFMLRANGLSYLSLANNTRVSLLKGLEDLEGLGSWGVTLTATGHPEATKPSQSQAPGILILQG